MSDHTSQTVGQLPSPGGDPSRLPAILTRLAWGLWLVSLGAVAGRLWTGEPWRLGEILAVDGLTVVLWATVTFFSGIVHSYARRYTAETDGRRRFFRRVFAFTLVVMVLVAAEALVVFAGAWLAMGLVMARLIGHADFPQATAAARISRRYFLASAGLLGGALGVLWWHTGATTVTGVARTVGTLPSPVVVVAATGLVLAAMVQSALVPFHGWMLTSMTAPTPASALMHAGFVNAGGVLLVRFASVVTVLTAVMLGIVVVGATSALVGALLKTVRPEIKGRLGCSTVGQMGFMLMQAGMGYFAAALAHLILHGFYKAYRFLAAGGQVTQASPAHSRSSRSAGPVGAGVVLVTALAGAALFTTLIGKGVTDSGVMLAMLVGLAVAHATHTMVTHAGLGPGVRYGAVPLVALPAIAVYAAVFRLIEALVIELPAVGQPTELTAVHGGVAVAFVLAYVAIERGAYKRSKRLYVALLNTTAPPAATQLTTREEYDEP